VPALCLNSDHVLANISLFCGYLQLETCNDAKVLYVFDVKYVSFFSASFVLKSVSSKAVPLQAWSGPEGSRKLRFPDFMTTAQENW